MENKIYTKGQRTVIGTRKQVICLGGAGLNILSELKGFQKINKIGVDSCRSHLNIYRGDASDIVLLSGRKIARGLSCGGDIQKGYDAAKETFEMIMPYMPNLFGNRVNLLVFGLGGGAGTGGALHLLQKLHGMRKTNELSYPIISICTFPLKMEKGRTLKAKKALKEVSEYSDLVLLFRLQLLLDRYPEGKRVMDIFQMANKMISLILMRASKSESFNMDIPPGICKQNMVDVFDSIGFPVEEQT